MAKGDVSGGRGPVLIVEDDPSSAELLSAVLEDEGFQPVVCSDARSAIVPFQDEPPVAVMIDWVIPGGSGIELCRRLRGLDPRVPIFFVSGRTDEASVSRGLDAGADDFVTKPFRRQELVARLDAHLRKLGTLPQPAGGERGGDARSAEPAPAASSSMRTVGDVEIDLVARTTRVRGRLVPLGALEFRLLEYLVRNAGVALSREQILREVHGYEDIPTDRVDLLVRRLRAKLDLGRWIVAVPGYGYRLERALRT
jgi:two-component system response regulator MtrA